MTKNMPYADVLKVYDAATPEQKEILQPVLRRKLERLIKEGQKPDEDDEYIARTRVNFRHHES